MYYSTVCTVLYTVGCINFLRWKSSTPVCFPGVSGEQNFFFFFLPQSRFASRLRVPTCFNENYRIPNALLPHLPGKS